MTAGAVYADKNHTKISREYSAIKRWLGTNLCHTHTKISDARTIKKRWLGLKLTQFTQSCIQR